MSAVFLKTTRGDLLNAAYIRCIDAPSTWANGRQLHAVHTPDPVEQYATTAEVKRFLRACEQERTGAEPYVPLNEGQQS